MSQRRKKKHLAHAVVGEEGSEGVEGGEEHQGGEGVAARGAHHRPVLTERNGDEHNSSKLEGGEQEAEWSGLGGGGLVEGLTSTPRGMRSTRARFTE